MHDHQGDLLEEIDLFVNFHFSPRYTVYTPRSNAKLDRVGAIVTVLSPAHVCVMSMIILVMLIVPWDNERHNHISSDSLFARAFTSQTTSANTPTSLQFDGPCKHGKMTPGELSAFSSI